MSEETTFSIRLSKAIKEFNVGKDIIVEFLAKKGFQIDPSPNTKLTAEMYELLVKEYQGEKEVKNEAKKLGNISYKGGSVSVESAMPSSPKQDDTETEEVIIRSTTISPIIPTKPAEPEEPQPEEKLEPKAEDPEPKTEPQPQAEAEPQESADGLKILGKIDLESLNPKKGNPKKEKEKKKGEKKQPEPQAKPQPKQQPKPQPKEKPKEQPKEQPKTEPVKKEPKTAPEPKFIKTEVQKLEGPKILDKIELPDEKHRTKATPERKKKRKRISGKPEGSSENPVDPNAGKQQQGGKQGKGQKPAEGGKKAPKDAGGKSKKDKGKPKREEKVELSDEEISKQIKDTLARLAPMGKSKASKHRREKRQQVAGTMMEEMMRQEEEKKVLKVTEFVTANELATMMNVPVVKVIGTCMSLGMPVSINQRLDAEALSVVAEEFGYQVDFVSADVQEAIAETE